jgi:inner membrane protein
MLGYTHLLFSFLFGSFLLDYFYPASLLAKVIFAALLLIGTFLPDIDQKIPGVKHREIFHTIWPVVLVLIANFFLQKYFNFSVIALAIGYGSHLFADMLTPCGIAPISPLHKHRIRGPIKTGSFFEFCLAAVIMTFLLLR